MPITQERFARVIEAGRKLANELEALQHGVLRQATASPELQQLALSIAPFSPAIVEAMAVIEIERVKTQAKWKENARKRDAMRQKRSTPAKPGPAAHYTPVDLEPEFTYEPPTPNDDWN